MQTTVNQKLAFGVPGSFYDDSPRRVDPYTVEEGAIGLAYTVNSSDASKADLGGTGVFAGIAVNTKEYIIDGLTASMAFREGDIAQCATMGRIVLKLGDAVTIGQACFYNETTGALKPGTAGATISDYVEIPNSKFVLVNALANEYSVLQLG
ncbi:MAG: hypothetical protein J6W29_03205 [Neisseriaceae bacterium]|nr:hypothetical protein [Neisseriaceae bacterium]